MVAAKVDFDQVSLDGVAAQETLVALAHATGQVDLKTATLARSKLPLYFKKKRHVGKFGNKQIAKNCGPHLTRLMNVIERMKKCILTTDHSELEMSMLASGY